VRPEAARINSFAVCCSVCYPAGARRMPRAGSLLRAGRGVALAVPLPDVAEPCTDDGPHQRGQAPAIGRTAIREIPRTIAEDSADHCPDDDAADAFAPTPRVARFGCAGRIPRSVHRAGREPRARRVCRERAQLVGRACEGARALRHDTLTFTTRGKQSGRGEGRNEAGARDANASQRTKHVKAHAWTSESLQGPDNANVELRPKEIERAERAYTSSAVCSNNCYTVEQGSRGASSPARRSLGFGGAPCRARTRQRGTCGMRGARDAARPRHAFRESGHRALFTPAP